MKKCSEGTPPVTPSGAKVKEKPVDKRTPVQVFRIGTLVNVIGAVRRIPLARFVNSAGGSRLAQLSACGRASRLPCAAYEHPNAIAVARHFRLGSSFDVRSLTISLQQGWPGRAAE
jgi:hypothetical protein